MNKLLTLILEVDGRTVEREFKLEAITEEKVDLHEVVTDMIDSITSIKNF